MEHNLIIWAYAIYLTITILLTLFVAKTLFKQGKIFMLDIFNGREAIALSTNRLFEVGFYLLNIGFAMLIMKIYRCNNLQQLVEILSQKIGGFSMYLGLMLFFNLYLFFRGKKKSKENHRKVNIPVEEKLIESQTINK